jgi:hypothetical protein
MIIMRPPQHGHERGNTDGSLGGAGLAASGCLSGIASSSRARAMLAARSPLVWQPEALTKN